jgi:acyl carrier protein
VTDLSPKVGFTLIPAIMLTDKTDKKLRLIFAQLFGIRHIRPEMQLTGDLGLDSLEITELVLTIEQKFKWMLPINCSLDFSRFV